MGSSSSPIPVNQPHILPSLPHPQISRSHVSSGCPFAFFPGEDLGRGTKINIYLKDEALEYADQEKLKARLKNRPPAI